MVGYSQAREIVGLYWSKPSHTIHWRFEGPVTRAQGSCMPTRTLENHVCTCVIRRYRPPSLSSSLSFYPSPPPLESVNRSIPPPTPSNYHFYPLPLHSPLLSDPNCISVISLSPPLPRPVIAPPLLRLGQVGETASTTISATHYSTTTTNTTTTWILPPATETSSVLP